MSFRAQLIAGFSGLAIVLALLFSLLSDALLRNGLEGEASERLALIGSLYPATLPKSLWPPKYQDRAELALSLERFSSRHQLHSAVLIFPDGLAVSGKSKNGDERAEDYMETDGVQLPISLTGSARVSAPLFQDEKGNWVKALYLKLEPERGTWLRLEAGTRLLGSVAKLRSRLSAIAIAVGFPALIAGVLMAWTLSRRAKQLENQLAGNPKSIHLSGSDEFSRVAQSMDRVLRDLESERRENERLNKARLDQAKSLSWGVAHELRNPLGGLSLLGELLSRKIDEKIPAQEAKDLVGRMKQEIDRMENTVATFLEFAKTPVLKIEPISVSNLLRQLSLGLKPELELEGPDYWALADVKALKVVLGVLLNNAREAAGENGRVTAVLEQAGPHCVLRIWDSGLPVAAEEQVKIFNPFFTTKPKGMGLGLANALALADAMQGSLTLANDGKTFYLRLKAAERE